MPGPSSRGSTQPTVECAEFLPSTPCGLYSSVRGASGRQDVAWAGSGSITARLESVSGSLYLTVTTPCAPLSGAASITGNILQVRSIAVGAMSCPGEPASQEAWVLEFLRRPIKLAYASGTLTWLSGPDTLGFKSH
ncbi:META domain-containing protein [Arthrobacter sp. MMS18-M83]|uniref:META domain-containing protein n=1 Tax=Arthrobacter sp. MMS18-M83 TaxID=2996261 RepID=UPI00227A949A|nr:META domain-containing protein [Arthrobacter sp. MMS18-M83]WAH98242.1 META domain-containing protein [Arthrobacter sp. MMS18-M83]